jgi:hypothetical protein
MRVRVTDVLDLLASGLTSDEVLAQHPDLEPEDITACLRFASWRLGGDASIANYTEERDSLFEGATLDDIFPGTQGDSESPLSAGEMPRTGADLVAYWERSGVVGSRSETDDSAAHARELRDRAQGPA